MNTGQAVFAQIIARVPHWEFQRAEVDSPEKRVRKAPGLGFHNFKGAFVTIALHSGIPLELIKKITGNVVGSVLENHYYRPEMEELGKMLREKMPAALVGEVASTAMEGEPAPKSLQAFLVLVRSQAEVLKPENALIVRATLLDELKKLGVGEPGAPKAA